MTRYLLAGGGTAGHVNPLLAVADALRAAEPEVEIRVLGTAEGLEARLVPARGYRLEVIPKVPFPRRLNRAALAFPAAFRNAQRRARDLLDAFRPDVVVGFGGYVATPVYLAGRAAGIPIVIHEANATPGLANRLGARFAAAVGVAFPDSGLPGETFVGMPLRAEIAAIAASPLARAERRLEAIAKFGLDATRPTLLVTGGSLGARRINLAVREAAAEILERGWQILHLVGGSPDIDDPGLDGYHQLHYLDRMDLGLAVADFAISRSGSSTVSELSALGIPAVYVPYPVGNGEQRRNAAGVVAAGGALLVDDAAFSAHWIAHELLPLLADSDRRDQLETAARLAGTVDGTARTVNLIQSVLA